MWFGPQGVLNALHQRVYWLFKSIAECEGAVVEQHETTNYAILQNPPAALDFADKISETNSTKSNNEISRIGKSAHFGQIQYPCHTVQYTLSISNAY